MLDVFVKEDAVADLSYNMSPSAGAESTRKYDGPLVAATSDWALQSRGLGGSVDATIGKGVDELVLDIEVTCEAEVRTEVNTL